MTLARQIEHGHLCWYRALRRRWSRDEGKPTRPLREPAQRIYAFHCPALGEDERIARLVIDGERHRPHADRARPEDCATGGVHEAGYGRPAHIPCGVGECDEHTPPARADRHDIGGQAADHGADWCPGLPIQHTQAVLAP